MVRNGKGEGRLTKIMRIIRGENLVAESPPPPPPVITYEMGKQIYFRTCKECNGNGDRAVPVAIHAVAELCGIQVRVVPEAEDKMETMDLAVESAREAGEEAKLSTAQQVKVLTEQIEAAERKLVSSLEARDREISAYTEERSLADKVRAFFGGDGQ